MLNCRDDVYKSGDCILKGIITEASTITNLDILICEHYVRYLLNSRARKSPRDIKETDRKQCRLYYRVLHFLYHFSK